MSANNLTTTYRLLNSSFRKTMIFHLGIDAGFFTEYTYMLHAMLYCLQHKIQFKLYSDDANFGWEKGWTDCFVPFCEEVHEAFHHTYNTHRLPSWKALMKDKKLPKTKLMKWKLKATCKNITGETLAFLTYKKPVLLNCHLKFDPNQHFHIPELPTPGRQPATPARIRRLPDTRRRQDHRNQPASGRVLHTPHQTENRLARCLRADR